MSNQSILKLLKIIKNYIFKIDFQVYVINQLNLIIMTNLKTTNTHKMLTRQTTKKINDLKKKYLKNKHNNQKIIDAAEGLCMLKNYNLKKTRKSTIELDNDYIIYENTNIENTNIENNKNPKLRRSKRIQRIEENTN